jgi:flagellar L-ring protein precursor FlgH
MNRALALASLLLAPGALGQSLLRPQESQPASTMGLSAEDAALRPPNEDLRATSMMYIDPPRPRVFHLHEQVTILIDENSAQSSKESLETNKDVQMDASLKKFPSLKAFVDGELLTGGSNPVVEFGAADKQKYKGEGTYSRNDRFTAKITAKVIDVKPNNTLVIEARKTIQTNDEIKVLVLSGVCRRDDVTNANTVLSSQLADLTIIQTTEGELRDGSKKGWITGLFEAIFNF